jgi:hypothetical protein
MADIGEVLELHKDAQEHASEGRMDDVQWLLRKLPRQAHTAEVELSATR